jgi:F-type H+-transporting ATPase subunit b
MTMAFPLLLGSHGGGFGLNLNLFDTNIINLAIVIAGLVWFLKGFLGGILERRRANILAELKDAEDRLAAATASLADVQKGLSESQARAEKIRADGVVRAQSIRLESERRTVEEMARIKQESASNLASLPGRLDATTQARLIDQSIQTLGNA